MFGKLSRELITGRKQLDETRIENHSITRDAPIEHCCLVSA